MAVALDFYEESLCPDCRIAAERAHDPEIDGWLKVNEQTCYGCEALEHYTGEHKEMARSVKLYVTDEGPADLTRRSRGAA